MKWQAHASKKYHEFAERQTHGIFPKIEILRK
jgi:hypothetical protein